MFKFLVCVLFVQSAFALDIIPQKFFRAGDKEIMAQVGYEFWEFDYDYYDDAGIDSYNGSSTLLNILAEYGITKDLSIGVFYQKAHARGLEDDKNTIFYLKGQYQSFFYEGQFSYFPDSERAEEDHGDGASHFNILLGYAFTKNINIRVIRGLEYDYEQSFGSGGSETYTEKPTTKIDISYEYYIGDHIIAGSLGKYFFDGREGEDGEEFGKFSLNTIELYGKFDIAGMVEFVPQYRHWVWTEAEDVKDGSTISQLVLEFRKRF